MHVCFVTSLSDYDIGGIFGAIIVNVGRRLCQRGHQVSVITRGRVGQTTVEERDGMTLYRVPFIPVYPWHVHLHGFFVNRLLQRLEGTFDVVHLHTPLPPVVQTKLPTVLTFHTPMRVDARHAEWIGPWSVVHKLFSYLISYRIERGLLRTADVVSAVSRSVALDLAEYGVDPERVRVLHNGVDHMRFTPPSEEWEEPCPYVLTVARLAPRKGLLDLVECARLVARRYPGVRFVLAGGGSLEGRLRRLVAKLGLGDKFLMRGHISFQSPDLVRLYQRAAVVVQPSHYEGMPGSLLEAMACGRPVVASDISAHAEVIRNEENGLLVPPHAPEAMAEAIVRLLKEREERVRLGRNARRTIEAEYTWEVVTDQYLACYQDLAERNTS